MNEYRQRHDPALPSGRRPGTQEARWVLGASLKRHRKYYLYRSSNSKSTSPKLVVIPTEPLRPRNFVLWTIKVESVAISSPPPTFSVSPIHIQDINGTGHVTSLSETSVTSVTSQIQAARPASIYSGLLLSIIKGARLQFVILLSYSMFCHLALLQHVLSSCSLTAYFVILLSYSMFCHLALLQHVLSSCSLTACFVILLSYSMFCHLALLQHVLSSCSLTACFVILLSYSMFCHLALLQHVLSSCSLTHVLSSCCLTSCFVILLSYIMFCHLAVLQHVLSSCSLTACFVILLSYTCFVILLSYIMFCHLAVLHHVLSSCSLTACFVILLSYSMFCHLALLQHVLSSCSLTACFATPSFPFLLWSLLVSLHPKCRRRRSSVTTVTPRADRQ